MPIKDFQKYHKGLKMSNTEPNLDTYFFDSKTALKIALENNEVPTSNPKIPGLQICYYTADAPLQETPENCIFVPLEEVYNYFVTTKNRIPKGLDFSNTSYSRVEQLQLKEAFDGIIQTAIFERDNLSKLYAQEIKNFQPNFNDEKWRVFIPCCRETLVMQYISKAIAKTFERLGYDVFVSTQDNAMQSCMDILPLLHNMYTFKPHITVNINHFVNEILHEDVFNFVWFQDAMPVLTNDSHQEVRQRDTIFFLIKYHQELLQKKGITSQYQPFCIDTITYKKREEILKQKKIVFIGSSYAERLTEFPFSQRVTQTLLKQFKKKLYYQ